jgi:hypothetical protein
MIHIILSALPEVDGQDFRASMPVDFRYYLDPQDQELR